MRLKNSLAFLATLAAAHAAFAVNPITPEGEFLSDPAPRVGEDGTLRLFGSRDAPEYGAIWCSHYNDIYETRDMEHWKILKGVLSSKGETDGIPETDLLLFAPDGIFVNGQWAVFYCTQDDKHVEGVAVSNTPEGPFKSLFTYPWANQIDPSIFRDGDGRLYYTFGQFDMKMCELKPDLSGFVPGTLRDNVVNEEQHGFHEGSQLFKRGDMYYLVFADISRRLRPTAIGYATAKSPYGPYTYRGVIVDNYGCDPKTWNNHGGVAEYNGKWYVFYHRSTNGEGWLRKACVEEIHFDEDGFIAEVEQTSHGAGLLLDPFVETPGRIACVLSGNARITTEKDGHEHLTGIKTGDMATWRYFDFKEPADKLTLVVVPTGGGVVELRNGRGETFGRVSIPSGDGKTPIKVKMSLSRTFPAGRNAVTLVFSDGRRWGDRMAAELYMIESFSFERQKEKRSQ